MLPASDIRPLDQSLYEIPFANLLYRPVGSTGGWYDGGDVDSFTLNINPTRKQRYAKNGSVSYLAIEATTRIDATVSAKFMQKTRFIRAAALMGVAYDVQQVAGAVTYAITDMVAGQFYAVGNYGVTDVGVKYMKGGVATDMPPGSFRLVDAALGIVQILSIPSDATATNGKIAGTVSATVSADNAAGADLKVDIGTVPQVALEVMVRNISDVGPKGYLHLFQWNAAPDGDMGFITAQEDFEGVTIKGRAAKTSQGIGYWRSLKA